MGTFKSKDWSKDAETDKETNKEIYYELKDYKINTRTPKPG